MANQTQSKARQGAAVVEFAICLPVILFIVFAGMDVTTVLRAKQVVVETTHETARVVATNEVNEDQCRQFAIDLLSQKDLTGSTVDFDPVPSVGMPRGTPITVTISVPVAGNCTVISRLFTSLAVESQSTVSREIGDLSLGQIPEPQY